MEGASRISVAAAAARRAAVAAAVAAEAQAGAGRGGGGGGDSGGFAKAAMPTGRAGNGARGGLEVQVAADALADAFSSFGGAVAAEEPSSPPREDRGGSSAMPQRRARRGARARTLSGCGARHARREHGFAAARGGRVGDRRAAAAGG